MFGKIIKFVQNYTYRLQLRMQKHVSISKAVDISNSNFDRYVNIAHHAQIADSEVGLRSSIGRYSKVRNAVIGKYCSISWDVTIGAVSHPMKAISTHAFSFRKKFGLSRENIMLEHNKCILGNDVWVGCNAVIMPGVKIGDGAVIGAGGGDHTRCVAL